MIEPVMPPNDRREDTVLRTLAFAEVEDLLVLCHTTAAPSDDEWNMWLQHESRRTHRALLIASAGGAPNSAQRARTAEAGKKHAGLRPPVALLTDSAMLRSVITAFNWLLGQEQRIKAFSPHAVSEALKWMEMEIDVARVEQTLARLQASLQSSPARR